MAATSITNLTNIITEPRLVFPELREKPTFIFPLLLLIAASIATLSYFFATVDFAWMIDQAVQVGGKSDAEREAMQKSMDQISIEMMGGSSIAGAVIGIPLAVSILAIYLSLVNKLLDSESLSFKSWFSLVCWCSIPSLFTSLTSLINVIQANGQITLGAVNPISFNSLFFNFNASNPLFGLLNSLDPMVIWGKVLLIFGFNHWTNSSLVKSTAIVIAPSLIFYGIGVAIKLI